MVNKRWLLILLINHGSAVNYVNTVRLLYVHGGHGVAQNGVGVSIHWTGPLDWTTGLTFDPKY